MFARPATSSGLRKLKKDVLVAMCKAAGISAQGTKDILAQALFAKSLFDSSSQTTAGAGQPLRRSARNAKQPTTVGTGSVTTATTTNTNNNNNNTDASDEALAEAVSSATSVSPPPASVSPPPAEALAAADYEAQIKDLEARVADLTAENAVLKQQLAELRAPVDVRPSDAASIAVAVAVTEVECSVSALAAVVVEDAPVVAVAVAAEDEQMVAVAEGDEQVVAAVGEDGQVAAMYEEDGQMTAVVVAKEVARTNAVAGPSNYATQGLAKARAAPKTPPRSASVASVYYPSPADVAAGHKRGRSSSSSAASSSPLRDGRPNPKRVRHDSPCHSPVSSETEVDRSLLVLSEGDGRSPLVPDPSPAKAVAGKKRDRLSSGSTSSVSSSNDGRPSRKRTRLGPSSPVIFEGGPVAEPDPAPPATARQLESVAASLQRLQRLTRPARPYVNPHAPQQSSPLRKTYTAGGDRSFASTSTETSSSPVGSPA